MSPEVRWARTENEALPGVCVCCSQGSWPGPHHHMVIQYCALPLNGVSVWHLYFCKFYGCGGCKNLLAFNILEFVYLLAISPSLLIAYISGSFPFHSGFCLLGSAWAVLSRVCLKGDCPWEVS